MILAFGFAQSDSTAIDLHFKSPKKEKFIDYFNLMQKAVRDYTPRHYFDPYEGQVINSIEIFIVDRFDEPVYERVCVEDAKFVENKRGKFSSSLIQKQVLFKVGSTVDPQLVADTERNIRESTIYKDALIKIDPSTFISGVDVKIYAHDNRHWRALFAGSPTSLKLGANFYDFFGVAQRTGFYGGGLINPTNPYDLGVFYEVNNIARSQVQLELNYNRQNLSESYTFSLKRKFFAYNTKYAGKLSISNNAKKIEDNTISSDYNNRYFHSEIWLARSFALPKFNLKHPTMRFIVSTRGSITKNYVIPEGQPFQNFVNKQFYLASFGLANRDWYGFEELYSFREFDYVPKGFNIAFIGGYEINQFLGGRYFSGITSNYSKQYEKFGFMQNEIKVGAFLRDKRFEQVTIQSINSYFTNRIKLRKLGFRQFLTTNATLSFYRPYSEFYNIGSSAIRGFDTQQLIGTKSFVLNTESVFYTPVKWWTSRGNFFFFADLGWVGTNNSDFLFSNTLYQGYGLGIRFQNRALSINYMEVSFGYYPNGYLVNEKNWGYQVGEIPPRKIGTNNLFTSDILTDIY
ncbi:MAG: hypothetical protein H6579_08240 [Chitinophagales bacterium]|nr:hypothetical protein [Chitinophagales bacterium]